MIAFGTDLNGLFMLLYSTVRKLSGYAALGLVCGVWTSVGMAHGSHGHESLTNKEKAESKFKLKLGLSVSKGFANTSSASNSDNAGSVDDHSAHHLLLHGGANDGDSGSTNTNSGSGSTETTSSPSEINPMMTARADYAFTKKVGFGLALGYGMSDGVQDPEAGPTLKIPLGKKTFFNTSVTASYPASKLSQANDKITTVKLDSGPTFEFGKLNVGIVGSVSYSWYSQTIINDDPATKAKSGLLSINGRAEAAPPFELHGGANDGDGGGATQGVAGASSTTTAGTDREFSRYGGRFNLGYAFSKSWRNDSSVGLSMVNHQFTDPTWATDTTVAQLSYLYASATAYVALLLSKESGDISAPTDPSASLGVNHVFK